ncbi:MAG: hypothetical protein ABII90_07770, partial [Bacteroidota bacterium]
LAGMGIRSSMRAGLSAGATDATAWINGAVAGTLQGGTTMALNLVGQELNIPPLYLSLGARAVTGAISGALSKDHDVFKGVGDAFMQSTLSLLTFGAYDPETGEFTKDPWIQATYIAQVLDFSQKVQEIGFLETLEAYTTAVFQQSTVSAIWEEGGIVDVIFNRINEGKIENIVYKGIQAKKVKIQEGEKEVYLIYSASEDKLLAIKDGNKLLETTDGQYEVGPDGKFGIKDGTITTYYDDGMVIVQEIANREQVNIDLMLPGDSTITVTGRNDIGAISYDSYGYLNDAYLSSDEFEMYLSNGEIERYRTELFPSDIVGGDVLIESAGITIDDLAGAQLVLEKQADGVFSTTIDAPMVSYVNGDGEDAIRYLGLDFEPETLNTPGTIEVIKTQSDKILNYFMGLGFRTDEEIATAKAIKVDLGRQFCQDGDTIYGSSGIKSGPMDTFLGLSIKAGEVLTDTNDSISMVKLLTNPVGYMASRAAQSGFDLFHDNKTTIVDHVGQVKTIDGIKYVIETNPGGIRKTLYEDYCSRYEDIEIVRANPGLKAGDAADELFFNYFDRETHEISEIAPKYDYVGILGITSRFLGNTFDTFICSELIVEAFRSVGITLPGIEYNLRISPQELWTNRDSWGIDLVELYQNAGS